MGLPRPARVRRPDFRSPGFAAGRRATAGPLVMHVVSDGPCPPMAGPVKVGFAVGRPVGGAVTRNAVRRRLRAAAREALPLVGVPTPAGAGPTGAGASPASRPALVLVRARPGVEDLGVADMAGLLSTAWTRVCTPRRGRR